MLCTLHLKALQVLLAVHQVRNKNRIRVFLYAVNYLNECYGFRIVLCAFYNWILTRYPGLCLRIAARDRKRCICDSFDVKWDITIVKTKKTQIDYSVQRDTSAEHEPSRNTPATSLINPQQQSHFTLSTLTFIRTISRHFYTISQHHHSPQSTDQTKHSSYKFSPHIYLPKVQAFERKKVGLSARVAKIMFIWSSIVGACLYTLSGKKSFRMSRWLASHTIPLWRLHELLDIRTTRMWIPHQQSRRVQYFLSPVHFTKQS